MITGLPLERIINGPAHHTLHHLYFTCNYGQVKLLHRASPHADLLTCASFPSSTSRGQTVLESLTATPNLL